MRPAPLATVTAGRHIVRADPAFPAKEADLKPVWRPRERRARAAEEPERASSGTCAESEHVAVGVNDAVFKHDQVVQAVADEEWYVRGTALGVGVAGITLGEPGISTTVPAR